MASRFSYLNEIICLNFYLWGAVKDKCYADKPETIDALNICKVIDEIQLHTINNVLKKKFEKIFCIFKTFSKKKVIDGAYINEKKKWIQNCLK